MGLAIFRRMEYLKENRGWFLKMLRYYEQRCSKRFFGALFLLSGIPGQRVTARLWRERSHKNEKERVQEDE